MRTLVFLLNKFIFLVVYLWGISNVTYAQELWGSTMIGGTDSIGSIFKTDGNGNNFTNVISFENKTAYDSYYAAFCLTPNGKVYTTLNRGGKYNQGAIISIDTASHEFEEFFSFDSINGGKPRGGLALAPNGLLYGMTSQGGLYNKGVLFELDPVNKTYTKKIDFQGPSNGRFPYGKLSLSANGKFYGMTSKGGSLDYGTLFEYDYNTNILTVKYEFNGYQNGMMPHGSLMMASNGKAYGMTSLGGTNNYGVLFEYDIISDSLIKKVDFAGISNGRFPYGNLIEVSNGTFYGMTSEGGSSDNGVIFRYNLNTSTFSKLFDFTYNNSGRNPMGSLVYTNGYLYGLTSHGSNSNAGTVFKYNLSLQAFSKLSNGGGKGSMLKLPNGQLYILIGSYIQFNGNIIKGLAYILYPNGGYSRTLVDFSSAIKGESPNASLFQANNGRFYGLTKQGGNYNGGALYKFNAINNNLKADISFIRYLFGIEPVGDLIQTSNNKIYGMTKLGGLNYKGQIFEYDINSGTITTVYSFGDSSGIKEPFGNLILASNGMLYGMTMEGGFAYSPIIFEFNPNTYAFSKKVDMYINGVALGFGILIQASNGKIYGATNTAGPNHAGTIFEYNINSNTISTVYSFGTNLQNGKNPSGGLVEGNNSKLYGTTYEGGLYNKGVIYEFDFLNKTSTVVHSFSGINGTRPIGSLLFASNGNFYGICASGGTYNNGTIYELNMNLNTLSTKHDFIKKSYPNSSYYPHLIEVSNYTSISENNYNSQSYDNNLVCYPNPTTGELTINLLKETEIIQLILRNSLGAKIQEQKFKNTKNIQLELNVPSGLYFLEIRTGDNNNILKVIKE